MSRFTSHLILLGNCIIGNVKKRLLTLRSPKPLPVCDNYNGRIIVSLTSFGRRVNETVYYTILSIMHQSLRPSAIFLWLDTTYWNENNIPDKLKKLQKYGVQIKFCEDIRSYKKLIPTLEHYQDSLIITVDDDVIYSRDLIKSLYESYLKNPHAVHATRAFLMKIANGEFTPYSKWNKATSSNIADNEYIFPTGVGGILYPPHSLFSDVTNRIYFQKLCPEADDIWFWYMARLNGFEHCLVYLPHNFYSFDAVYQALHRGSALTHSNVKECHNDIQLSNLLQFYEYKTILTSKI